MVNDLLAGRCECGDEPLLAGTQAVGVPRLGILVGSGGVIGALAGVGGGVGGSSSE